MSGLDLTLTDVSARLTADGAFVFAGYVCQTAQSFPDRPAVEILKQFSRAFEGQTWVMRPPANASTTTPFTSTSHEQN